MHAREKKAVSRLKLTASVVGVGSHVHIKTRLGHPQTNGRIRGASTRKRVIAGSFSQLRRDEGKNQNSGVRAHEDLTLEFKN